MRLTDLVVALPTLRPDVAASPALYLPEATYLPSLVEFTFRPCY